MEQRGWLSESQMDNQLIRVSSRGGGGRGDGGRRRGERVEGGGRQRRGEEVFSGCPVPCLCASLGVSEPDWKWQQQQHPCSVIRHAQMKNRVCIIPVEECTATR